MNKLPKPIYDQSVTNFYYAQQLKHYAIQFMAIFADMQVMSGKNDYNSQSNLIHVPIKYGSMDRVVGAIKANNTQNTMMRVPIMAANLIDFDIAKEKMAGQGTGDRHVYLPTGSVFPDDLKVVYRRKHIPYNAIFELSVLTSNKDQQFQIMEQICLLFDPILQFQTSDDEFNASKITVVELKSITFDENYPSGADKRYIQTNFTFETPFYLSAPYDVRTEVVKKIMLRLEAIPTYQSFIQSAETERPLPEYEELFSLGDFEIPKQ